MSVLLGSLPVLFPFPFLPVYFLGMNTILLSASPLPILLLSIDSPSDFRASCLFSCPGNDAVASVSKEANFIVKGMVASASC